MRQRPFFGRIAQEHSDDGPHVVLDLDDEHLLVITDKNRATAVGGQDPPDLDRHNIFFHTVSLGEERQKTSPVCKL